MGLEGAMSKNFVPPTESRLKVMRGGRAMVRDWKIPKPVVLVDTREQAPFPLLENHPNWIGGERRATLNAGDYSIEGMEDLVALERKSMCDAINSVMSWRERFLKSCERMSTYRWKGIILEATYEDMKTPYSYFEDLKDAEAHPNGVVGTYSAIAAKWAIPVMYASRDRGLATEMAASWLSKIHMYHWLEQNGHGRVLIDADGL